jgi:hypothetical protein
MLVNGRPHKRATTGAGMNHKTSHTFRNELAGPHSAAPAPWLLGVLRQLRLPTVFAALALLALCLAFVDVVSGAALQGQARKQAQLSQADTAWRCNAQSDAQGEQRMKINCRAEPAVTANLRQGPLHDPELVAARRAADVVFSGSASDGRAFNLIGP